MRCDVFTKKKKELGAKHAARELNVSLGSFYNYAAGKDLPRMEVLRDAQQKWDTKWPWIDPSEIFLQTPLVSWPSYACRLWGSIMIESEKRAVPLLAVTRVPSSGLSAVQP